MSGAKLLSKYRNKRTNGYASKKEALWAAKLKLWQQAGAITELEEQVRYELIPAQEGERPCSYIADFRYRDLKDGQIHVLDAKGMRTEVYKIKKKLMLFRHGIRIEEV